MSNGRGRISLFRPYVTEQARDRVNQVLASGWIGQGPIVAEFERRFEEVIGVPGAVAVNSGTSALHLALTCLGVGSGDEVITTAQTFVATSLVILQNGAQPVFADVQYGTGNIDPADIEHRITDRTRAILVVHWGGYPCDLDEIQEIAARHGLAVIEDAAHAIGATYHDRSIGVSSRFTCFSFQAIKHLTTGDGGMIVAPAPDDYEMARRRRWFGLDRDRRQPSELGEPVWDIAEIGFKYHMNDIAAAMGVAHLEAFPAMLAQRRRFASMYRSGLAGVPGVSLFDECSGRENAYWLFDLHVERRLDFIRMLKGKNIDSSVLHQRIDTNSVFGGLRRDLPTLERFDDTHVCLPMHNGLADDDVEYVIRCVREGW